MASRGSCWKLDRAKVTMHLVWIRECLLKSHEKVLELGQHQSYPAFKLIQDFVGLNDRCLLTDLLCKISPAEERVVAVFANPDVDARLFRGLLGPRIGFTLSQ